MTELPPSDASIGLQGLLVLVVEDSTDALRWACGSLVAPPPGVTRAHALLDAAIRILRRRPGTAGSLAAGRIVVGRTR